jgi:DNA polymerase III epsilon subunit-like protein
MALVRHDWKLPKIQAMKPLVILDVEHTGPTNRKMVEFGAFRIDLAKPTAKPAKFVQRYKPLCEVEWQGMKTHGIHHNHLTFEPVFDRTQARRLAEFIGDAPIVAHSAGSDRGVILREMYQALPRREYLHLFQGRDWHCTKELAKWRKRLDEKASWTGNTLGEVAEALGIKPKGELHGALVDADVAARIYLDTFRWYRKHEKQLNAAADHLAIMSKISHRWLPTL